MSQGNHAYIDHVRRLEQRLGSGNEALRLAVGGESEAVGKLEYYLLRSLGLTRGPLVVDIGCGSGRLAQQLAPDKGHVVISFLEFRIPCHWETLIASVKAKAGGPLIQFLDRDAIAAWQVIAALPSTPLSTATKVISRFPKRFGG